MLYDIISDAEADMQRELESWPEVHEWLRPRIDSLLQEMARVRFLLDVNGTPAESVWLHVRPLLPLLEQTPLDHEAINRLIDTILAQGPPTKEQFREWAKLLLDQNEGRPLDTEQIKTVVEKWNQVPGNVTVTKAVKKKQPKSR